MNFDYYIKPCPSCDALVPIKDKFCKDCKFKFGNRALTNVEINTPLNVVISNINSAFLRLENFMNGILSDYKSFDFIQNFDLLFVKTKLSENYTIEICNLVNHYWNLTEQLRVDTDKGNYKNKTAYDNKWFIEDIEAIGYINHYEAYKFLEFITQEQIAKREKKFTISNISQNLIAANAAPQIKPTLSLRQIALLCCYKGEIITRGEVANRKALDNGYKSGDKLYQMFSFYSDRRHRINIIEGAKSDTTLDVKIKLMESVIELLQYDLKAQKAAIDELKSLKSKHQN